MNLIYIYALQVILIANEEATDQHWIGRNCLHPVFEVEEEYFKPEKPQDTNGLRSLHLQHIKATVILFHTFVEVDFRTCSAEAVSSKGLLSKPQCSLLRK